MNHNRDGRNIYRSKSQHKHSLLLCKQVLFLIQTFITAFSLKCHGFSLTNYRTLNCCPFMFISGFEERMGTLKLIPIHCKGDLSGDCNKVVKRFFKCQLCIYSQLKWRWKLRNVIVFVSFLFTWISGGKKWHACASCYVFHAHSYSTTWWHNLTPPAPSFCHLASHYLF